MKAVSADGVEHVFPDATDPAVVDRVMKNYAINHGRVEPAHGAQHDSFWANNAAGRVLSAFGQSAVDNWGAMTAPSDVAAKWVTDKTEEALRNAGILNQHKEQQGFFVKSINEALWRPSAMALHDFMMAVPEAAGAIGAATGAVTGGLGQAAKEFGFPKVGEAIRGAPELLPGLIGVPGTPPILRQARGLRVIGEGEGGFKEVEKPSLELTKPTEGPAQGRLPFPGFRTEVTEELSQPSIAGIPEIVSNPGGGFDVHTNSPAGVLYAATRDEAEVLAQQHGLFGGPPANDITGDINPIVVPKDVTKVAPPEVANDPIPTKSYLTSDGKIDLKQLESPRDIEVAISQASRGVSEVEPSPQMISDLAEALGVPSENLVGRDHGSPEEIQTKIDLLTRSASDIHDIATRIPDKADITALTEFIEAKDRHLMIQETLSGLPKAERISEEIGTFTQQTEGGAPVSAEQIQRVAQIEQQQQAVSRGIAAYGRPGQVSNFLNASRKPGFFDMLLEFWINGLLSGFATHSTYAIGNFVLLGMHALEHTVAGAIGKLHGGEKVYLGESIAGGIFGATKGAANGIIAAWEAAKTGLTQRLPGEKQASFAFSQTKAIPGPAGTVVRVPTHMTASIHSAARMVGYEQGLGELAYRRAVEEGGTPGTWKFANRVRYWSENPTTQMMEIARGQSTDMALMGRGGPWVSQLGDFTNANPWIKPIIPFARMSGNAVRQGLLERTPLGALLSRDIRANLTGRNGAVARDSQIAKVAVGTAIGAAVFGLAEQGLVTGSGPDKPDEARVWRATGKQPYSLRIGDTWYSMQRLGTLALSFGLVADMSEFGQKMESGETDKVAALLTSAFAHALVDETWLRGPADLINAVTRPEDKGQYYIQNQLSSLMPFSVGMGQLARAIDPEVREARTIVDAFKAKTPWLSETLLPKRDIWGEPIPSRDALGAAGLTAIYESRADADPIAATLERLGMGMTAVPRTIRGVTLTDAQHDDFARLAGRMARAQLNQIVAPGFDRLPVFAQRDIIANVVKHTRESARGLVMIQNPSIIEAGIRNKLEVIEGAKPTRPIKQ